MKCICLLASSGVYDNFLYAQTLLSIFLLLFSVQIYIAANVLGLHKFLHLKNPKSLASSSYNSRVIVKRHMDRLQSTNPPMPHLLHGHMEFLEERTIT